MSSVKCVKKHHMITLLQVERISFEAETCTVRVAATCTTPHVEKTLERFNNKMFLLEPVLVVMSVFQGL